MKQVRVLKIVFIAMSVFLLTWRAGAQTTVQGSFIHGGIARTYRIYVPAIYNSSVPVPLVLNLHGYGSNNTSQEAYGDFRPIADTANFIIVHPNGTLDGSGNLYWNSFGWSLVDDVGFLSALIDTVSAAYTIDENSIYSTGMSNGGFMSYDLACSLSSRIAAIASVTGSMTPGHKNSCVPLRPVPVMQIHGTADATVPYNGSATMVHIDSLVKFWVQYNNCLPAPAITALPDVNATDGCTAERHLFSGGAMGSTVELYKVNGGGHSWPGAPVNINVTNMDFSASREIWRFFRKYKLSGLTGEEPGPGLSSLSVFPNPADGIFYLKTENPDGRQPGIKIYNVLGEPVAARVQPGGNSGEVQIDLSLQPEGIYFVLLSLEGFTKKGKIIKSNGFLKN